MTTWIGPTRCQTGMRGYGPSWNARCAAVRFARVAPAGAAFDGVDQVEGAT